MSRTRDKIPSSWTATWTPATGMPQVFLSSLVDDGRDLSGFLDIGPVVTVLLPGNTGETRVSVAAIQDMAMAFLGGHVEAHAASLTRWQDNSDGPSSVREVKLVTCQAREKPLFQTPEAWGSLPARPVEESILRPI